MTPAPAFAQAAQDRFNPLLGPWLKGFPPAAEPVHRQDLAARRWQVLNGDLPLPVAVLKASALTHNIAWMAAFARERGLELAPHGKTTMSPQLFERQIMAGAWGITFATVTQLRMGVATGLRRTLIANQVHTTPDLDGLARLLAETEGLRVVFLLDSLAQLRLIEQWHQRQAQPPVFEVLLELGLAGGRTGVREHDDALALAHAAKASPAVRLVGIECYEGLGVSGDGDTDRRMVDALMARVAALAQACEDADLFQTDASGEVLITAGGSALFDLVAPGLRPALRRPVVGLLRSGCYVTHDHGHYKRLVHQLAQRCGCADELQPALEVWTAVQSVPEPGLALLTGGRRDLSFDIDLPHPLTLARGGVLHPLPRDGRWRITGLNDQHAHLRFDDVSALQPRVGDLLALGISHPCTTFDKWHWMPVVDDDYSVVDAVTMQF